MNMPRAMLPPSSDDSVVASATGGEEHISKSQTIEKSGSLHQIVKYESVKVMNDIMYLFMKFYGS